MKKSEKRKADPLNRPLVNRQRDKYFWVFIVEFVIVGAVVIGSYFVAQHYGLKKIPLLHTELNRLFK